MTLRAGLVRHLVDREYRRGKVCRRYRYFGAAFLLLYVVGGERVGSGMVIESESVFWALVAALFITFVLLMLIASAFGYSAVVRGQGRGYRPAGLTIGMLLIVLTAVSVPIAVVARAVDLSRPSPTTDLLPIALVALGSGAAVVGAVVAWSLAVTLPSRLSRRPGLRPRRYRYQVWSYVALALTAGAVIWAWLTTNLSDTIRIAMIGSTLTVGLRWLESRLGSQLASVPAEISGHVLYLRPFRTESRALFQLPNDRAQFSGQGLRNWVTLDEFLVRGAGERLGPVIALGNPAEFLPPGGATRVYLSDDAWQEELADLAVRASQIIMQPGRTQSMRWELRYIAAMGLQTKLFIFTAHHRSALLRHLIVPIMDRLNGWDPPTWPEFTQELNAVGLTVRCGDPGPGALVGFDGAGTAVVIARNLKDPEDFADAILRHAGGSL